MPTARCSPVMRKRIEPAEVEWLSSATSALPALSLLQRAQRHLKTLHRVSEVLAGARDLQALADVALETILDVTAADRAALVLRREGTSTGEADVAAARLRNSEQGHVYAEPHARGRHDHEGRVDVRARCQLPTRGSRAARASSGRASGR